MLGGLSPLEGEDDSNMSKVMEAKAKYLKRFPRKNPKYTMGTRKTFILQRVSSVIHRNYIQN